MRIHEECYGRMFPPVDDLVRNRDIAGAVFRYRVEQPGPSSTTRSSGFDASAWDLCTACDDFDTCYRLSVGALLMHLATRV